MCSSESMKDLCKHTRPSLVHSYISILGRIEAETHTVTTSHFPSVPTDFWSGVCDCCVVKENKWQPCSLNNRSFNICFFKYTQSCICCVWTASVSLTSLCSEWRHVLTISHSKRPGRQQVTVCWKVRWLQRKDKWNEMKLNHYSVDTRWVRPWKWVKWAFPDVNSP